MNSLSPNLWVDRYGDYLYSIAVVRMRNKELAEDVVQETFLFAYKSRESFKGKSSEKTWLTAILNNKITDYFRKKDVLKEVGIYLSDTSDRFFNEFFESEDSRRGHWRREVFPLAWDSSVDHDLQQKEFRDALARCISRLPTSLSYAFTAKHLAEKKAEEICKDLRISPSNYWVMLHRAKLLLRACLESLWYKP